MVDVVSAWVIDLRQQIMHVFMAQCSDAVVNNNEWGLEIRVPDFRPKISTHHKSNERRLSLNSSAFHDPREFLLKVLRGPGVRIKRPGTVLKLQAAGPDFIHMPAVAVVIPATAATAAAAREQRGDDGKKSHAWTIHRKEQT